MQGYRERRLTGQDGLQLYFRDYGDPHASKTAVLCLAGLTRNSADYHEVALRLARERRVLCPDYRGRGRSDYDRNWRNYEPRTYLNDALHLLTATGVGRAIVIGTSMGGLLAMGLAVLRPLAVAAVVLNDIGPELEGSGLARILDYVGNDHPMPDMEHAARFLKHLLPHLAPKADRHWWLRLAEHTYRKGEDGLLHFDWDLNLARPLQDRLRTRPDLWTLYRGLARIPTLSLRGALSDVLSEQVVRRMALEKPDLVCVTVADIGHTPTLSEPEAVSALDAFLEPL